MFEIDLRISIDLHPSISGNRRGMSDWADDAIRKLQQKRDDQRLKAETFLEQQKIKRANGIPLWDEVRARIRARISELKEKSGGSSIVTIQSDQPGEMLVRSEVGGGQLLHARFKEDTGQLTWWCANKDKDGWEVAVTEGGGSCFQRGIIVTTPDSIATQMLNTLLDV
jgi:hypothetical protein